MERNRNMSDFFFFLVGEHTASTIPKNTHTHTLKSEHMQEPKRSNEISREVRST